MKYVLAVLLLCSLAVAQDTVRIIPLKPHDGATAYEISQRIARAQKLLDDAKSDMDKFQKNVESDYITVEQSDPDHGDQSIGRKGECNNVSCWTIPTTAVVTFGEPSKELLAEEAAERKKYDTEHPYIYHRKGFEYGFRFSEDYRFIVPASPPPVYAPTSSFGGIGNCVTLTGTVGQ